MIVLSESAARERARALVIRAREARRIARAGGRAPL
jgi:hypothetical protein